MDATRYQILERSKPFSISVARFDDFELAEPAAFDPAHILAKDGPAQWSLYAVDVERDIAVFVELPADLDLSAVPFAYTAQHENAQSVVTLPLADLEALSGHVTGSRRLSVLFSTGRCGSTLASRILSQIPDVWSVSEPDFLTNLALERTRLSDDRQKALLAACAAITCAEAPAGAEVIIKPRSEAAFVMVPFCQANPDARAVFLYRDAAGYANSMYRMVQRLDPNHDFLADPEAHQLGWFFASAQGPEAEAEPFLAPGATSFSNLETMALAWLLRIQAAEQAAKAGIAVTALHYADLTADPRDGTAQLLSACGLGGEHLSAGLRGFERDAHSGSATANSVPAEDLSAANQQQVADCLARWGQPDLATTRLDLRP